MGHKVLGRKCSMESSSKSVVADSKLPKRDSRGRRRGVQFVRDNLELLGFGSPKDALVQAVKELFENALDATLAMNAESSWEDAPLELLRIHVCANPSTGLVDIVCADTGSGIRAHQLRLLCCGAFETTRSGAAARGERASGKYGVGLKAAMLYSQLHTVGACLKITTTSSSDEILHVQLSIDPDSEETAVVQHVTPFVVDEDHQRFSGTEMRLSIPCPEKVEEVEDAADSLALYFQSLRYTTPPCVAVQFAFDVRETNTVVECQHQEEPVDRFVADLGEDTDGIIYVNHEAGLFSVNCMALLTGNLSPSQPSALEICLLRYANHVPLLSCEDIFLCGITKGVGAKKIWKKYGFSCRSTGSHLVNQLAATALRGHEEAADEAARLVIAIDVCTANVTSDGGLKYGSMRKSTLDPCYTAAVQTCCQSVLKELEEAGKLCTPRQCQDRDLADNFAPLVAKAVASIANRAQAASGRTTNGAPLQLFDEDAVTRRLQEVLRDH